MHIYMFYRKNNTYNIHTDTHAHIQIYCGDHTLLPASLRVLTFFNLISWECVEHQSPVFLWFGNVIWIYSANWTIILSPDRAGQLTVWRYWPWVLLFVESCNPAVNRLRYFRKQQAASPSSSRRPAHPAHTRCPWFVVFGCGSEASHAFHDYFSGFRTIMRMPVKGAMSKSESAKMWYSPNITSHNKNICLFHGCTERYCAYPQISMNVPWMSVRQKLSAPTWREDSTARVGMASSAMGSCAPVSHNKRNRNTICMHFRVVSRAATVKSMRKADWLVETTWYQLANQLYINFTAVRLLPGAPLTNMD